MQYFTLFPLQGYWGKWLGVGLILLALVTGLLVVVLESRFLDGYLLPEQQKAVIAWIMASGLFTLSFSKEKVDDERVQRIRYVALRGTAIFTFSLPLALAFFFIWVKMPDKPVVAYEALPEAILCLLVLPLLLYQILFTIGLRLEPAWAYNDLSAEANIRKNPLFRKFMILELLALLGLILYALFAR